MDRMLEGKSDVSQCKWEGVKMFNDCNVGTDEDITYRKGLKGNSTCIFKYILLGWLKSIFETKIA